MNISGSDGKEVTPVPIPNTEVKLFSADGTARDSLWESRTLPVHKRPQSGYTWSGPFFMENALFGEKFK